MELEPWQFTAAIIVAACLGSIVGAIISTILVSCMVVAGQADRQAEQAQAIEKYVEEAKAQSRRSHAGRS